MVVVSLTQLEVELTYQNYGTVLSWLWSVQLHFIIGRDLISVIVRKHCKEKTTL